LIHNLIKTPPPFSLGASWAHRV